MISLATISLISGGLFVVLYLAYRALLPKPLAGIPYNKDAANKLFGDVPEVMGYVKSTKQIYAWFTELAVKHKSPVVQAFIKPGSLPWVVVTDPYEIQDILLRRTKDFDRASFFHDVLSGIIQYQASQYVSDHPIYKHNKNLINHLMAPSFINQISAPEVYKSVINLIQVWEVKCDKAEGRPFAAHHDTTYQALDFIFAALFEVTGDDSITVQRLKTISSYTPSFTAPSSNSMEPVPFPDGPVPQPQASFLTLTNSIMHTQLSPFPTLTSTIHTKFPSMRHAISTKESFFRNKIDQAVSHIDKDPSSPPRNAIHSVLLRERETALKESRTPDYHQRGIYDEFVGLVMAGHDTSATSVAWGVKYLADAPAVQTRLRSALKNAFPDAARQNRAPNFEELMSSHIPYLDAVTEEVLRLASSIDFVVRVALRDTTVLGRHIPKGTDVFLAGNGPGFHKASMPLGLSEQDDEIRSPGARKKNGKMLSGLWEDEGIHEFKPERWLKKDGEGKEVFDPLAGPTLAFGLGPRGCFGKRLALVSLRMQFALIIWHFELLGGMPEKMCHFRAVQKFAREPEVCFVRLKRVDMTGV
ncbi:cytochrome P450 [Rhypophila decipiens]|uniref:Cytochrome P450 n=1 Tax=Rhypophila decipiens TaxID=261697 RepID=A0AAN6XUS3_9PEZI|nr:cytochrome P450 [Rhypophila decipiens]